MNSEKIENVIVAIGVLGIIIVLGSLTIIGNSQFETRQQSYVGKCIDMPPLASARVLKRIASASNNSVEDQYQIEETDSQGKQSVVFAPSAFVLESKPFDCL